MGITRRPSQALSSGGLVQVTHEVMKQMLVKHLQSPPPPCIIPDPSPSPPNISNQNVLRALMSFQGGSAPGPSSVWAINPKQAVLYPSQNLNSQTIRSHSKVVRLLVAVHAPQEVIHASVVSPSSLARNSNHLASSISSLVDAAETPPSISAPSPTALMRQSTIFFFFSITVLSI